MTLADKGTGGQSSAAADTVCAKPGSSESLGDTGGSAVRDEAEPTPEHISEHISERIGATVGRYILVAKAGAGGMGVVYLAYDPELDRRVALKLLIADVTAGQGLADAQARLLREAQALARVAHPNVIPVFDVGGVGDEVFVAMEFVEGQTVNNWLRAEQRSLHEILDVFRASSIEHRASSIEHRASSIEHRAVVFLRLTTLV